MTENTLSPTPVAVPTASLPSVNLLPPEIAEAERFRRTQLTMGAIVGVAVVAVAGLYLHEHSKVSSEKQALASAQAQQSSLQQQKSSLQSVQAVYDQVNAEQTTLRTAMAGEVRWSFVLNDLSMTMTPNVFLTSMSATQTNTGLGSTTGAAPASAATATSLPNAIGQVQFSVVALSDDDLANWLVTLSKEKGFAAPDFTTANEATIGSRTVVDASTSATLTTDALSNRYTTGTN